MSASSLIRGLAGWIVVVATCTLTACDKTNEDGGKTFVLEEAQVIQGTTFSVGTEITTYKDGTLQHAVLGAEQPVADIQYAEDFPHVFPKGTRIEYQVILAGSVHEMPTDIQLKEPYTYMGLALPARSEIDPGVVTGTIGDEPVDRVPFVQIRLGGAATLKGTPLEAGTYLQVSSPDEVFVEKGTDLVPL